MDRPVRLSLKALRKRQGMTQKELAAKLQVSFQTIRKRDYPAGYRLSSETCRCLWRQHGCPAWHPAAGDGRALAQV